MDLTFYYYVFFEGSVILTGPGRNVGSSSVNILYNIQYCIVFLISYIYGNIYKEFNDRTNS